MTEQDLSCFFVRELFPLKSEGTLDAIRKKKIETHLGTCKECKAYYDRLEKARATVIALAGTKPTPAMINYLKAEHHFWIDSIQRLVWKRWPSTVKWAVELSLVTGGLILTIHYFPWLQLARTLQNARPAPMIMAPQVPVDQPISNSPTTNQPISIAANTPAPEAEEAESTPAPAVSVVAASTPTEQAVAAADEAEENTQTAGVVPNESDQKMAGFVWRGSLKVEELTDQVAARVTKVIIDLGGTKAGQVELGWHRGKQRYYHFILPEENYEKFLSVLNEEGIVQLTKERHPRTIRQGHMRIIMTVEESQE